MEIHIETKNLPNDDMAVEYFTKRLKQKFIKYQFITRVNLSFTMDKSEDYQAKISLSPKNGNVLFAKCQEHSQRDAFENCIQKIEPQIEKYKTAYYHK